MKLGYSVDTISTHTRVNFHLTIVEVMSFTVLNALHICTECELYEGRSKSFATSYLH